MTTGSAWTQRVASFYSRSASGYEELWAPELIKLARSLIDALPLAAANRILDVGSGVGTLVPEIQGRAPDAFVVGSDIAYGMLRRAPGHFSRVASDAQQPPFADGSFDVAILAFMLFHVPSPQKALQETRRVLREGAAVGTTTWADEPGYLAADIWNEELDLRGADEAPEIARHELVDTAEKITEMLETAGFREVRTWIGLREAQLDVDSFLRHRTGHGSSRHRLESLPEPVRAEVVKATFERVRDLGPEAFFDRSEVLYATASAS